jgi:hypothetical protein
LPKNWLLWSISAVNSSVKGALDSRRTIER